MTCIQFFTCLTVECLWGSNICSKSLCFRKYGHRIVLVADIALEAKDDWVKAVVEICKELEQCAESVRYMLGEIIAVARDRVRSCVFCFFNFEKCFEWMPSR